MKKYILLPAMMVAAMLSTTAVKAQEDVNPLLKYVNKENDLKSSIGGRMFADVAYYHKEWNPYGQEQYQQADETAGERSGRRRGEGISPQSASSVFQSILQH